MPSVQQLQMTIARLQDTQRTSLGVQNTVAEACRKTVLSCDVSLTSFNQTSNISNPNNAAFDAEGLTKLTQETERRRRGT